jgi:hypothetical protein
VVIESLDRNALRELGKPADVIAVIVRQHEMIDLPHTSILERQHDAIRVASAGIADVDEQRFPGWCHEECRLAAFGIDVIDLQCFRGRLRPSRLRDHTCCEHQC